MTPGDNFIDGLPVLKKPVPTQSNTVDGLPILKKKEPATSSASTTGSKPFQDPELQKQMKAYWNHLSPKEQQSLQSAAIDRINHPDRIRAATKEEVEGQKAMDTTLGKVKKSLAYIGSETTKGGVQVLKGSAWLLN